MSARDQALRVEIVDGRLVISIGIDALMVAAMGSDLFDFEAGDEIESADGFADDILRALEEEEDDGTTLVHVAIDGAVKRALDGGSLHVRYGCDQSDQSEE